MWRRPAYQTLSEALDISSATARLVTDLLKALVILSDRTVRRSAADREDISHTGNQKNSHISLGDQQSYHPIGLSPNPITQWTASITQC